MFNNLSLLKNYDFHTHRKRMKSLQLLHLIANLYALKLTFYKFFGCSPEASTSFKGVIEKITILSYLQNIIRLIK